MGLPYFPMYPTDFEADTSHLSMAEDGAYNRLLRICWMTPGCSMPADEAWIMRRVRAHSDEDKQAVKAVLGEFFTIIKGRYSNARLAREFAAAREAHEKRKKAGSKGGRAKAAKVNDFTSSNAKAMPKQPEPEPEPYKDRDTVVSLARKPKPERFEDFWNQYPHRNGAKKGKAKARQKYERLVASGVSEHEIITGAMRYATDRQVVEGYAKDPTTWLNNEGWTDDIEPAQPSRANSNGSGTGQRSSMVDAFAAVAEHRSRDAGGGGGTLI